MEPVTATGSKRAEALLNEYKGNIYEFLVAHNMAKAGNIESVFMNSIKADFYTMLGQQESFIREYYPRLLDDLPLLAQGLAAKIVEDLPGSMVELQIIGKAAAGLGSEGYGEGDILVRLASGPNIPVSVKLSKASAFVNTKSAGVKSFLSKYFQVFSNCPQAQSSLSSFFDREFEAMAYALHEKAGIEYDPGFENWKGAGMTQLPGELNPELRSVFLESLYKVNNKLFEALKEFREFDENLFLQSLAPLLGYSRSDITQAATFYHPTEQGYQLQSHVVESGFALKKMSVKSIENRPRTSSFDIALEDRVLQIRLKAMNKFTGKGFKVNCAVKARP